MYLVSVVQPVFVPSSVIDDEVRGALTPYLYRQLLPSCILSVYLNEVHMLRMKVSTLCHVGDA